MFCPERCALGLGILLQYIDSMVNLLRSGHIDDGFKTDSRSVLNCLPYFGLLYCLI